MRTISDALKSHLAQEVTTLTTCWRLTTVDAAVYRFTALDRDITLGMETFAASAGFLASALDQSRGLAVDNLTATTVLGALGFDADDILAGIFDYATVDIFICNWADLSQGVMYLAQGWTLGEVSVADLAVEDELRSKAQKLQQQLGELYSQTCRADLGDARCQAVLTYYPGEVTEAISSTSFIDSTMSQPTGAFNFGKLVWLTGDNAGFEMEVKGWNLTTHTMTLFEPMYYEIQVGDTYEVHQGCDKYLATCRDVWNNVVNFRGEPHIPGRDKALDYRVPPQ